MATPVAAPEVPGARAGCYPVLPGRAVPRPPPCLVINMRLSPKRVSEEEFYLDKAMFPMSNSFPARQAPSQEEQCVAFLDKAWFSMSNSFPARQAPSREEQYRGGSIWTRQGISMSYSRPPMAVICTSRGACGPRRRGPVPGGVTYWHPLREPSRRTWVSR